MSGRPTFLVRNDWKPGTLHCHFFAVKEIKRIGRVKFERDTLASGLR